MLDLAKLLHEISVAFATSPNLRTLLPRLADALTPELPVVEVQIAALDRARESVLITAYAPDSKRRWNGERSARFLERQGVDAPSWSDDGEPARVGSAPVETRLKMPVGADGMLSIAFENDISVVMGEQESTDILVDVLEGHCRRLGQLDALARRCRLVHRYISEGEPPAEPPKYEISVDRESPSRPPPVEEPTDIAVRTIDEALVDCIGAALRTTRGRIYGEQGAAKLLGLKPSTLQSKMRKLGIERDDFT